MSFEAGIEPKLNSSFYIDAIERPDHRLQLESLLNRSFPVAEGGSFYDDFPVWDHRSYSDPRSQSPQGSQSLQNPMVQIGVFRNKKLASTASVRIADLKARGGQVRVALIGAVATDSAWRGHGLASKTVALATQWAQERGAALAVLWGSEHSLYQRMGFELCGEQVRVPLAAAFAKLKIDPHSLGSTPMGRGWKPELFDILKKRPGGLALRASDERWISAHKNVQWYWNGEGSTPRAYAAIGRGMDLHGLVHEWGGEKKALMELLAQISVEHPEASLLGAPQMVRPLGLAFDPQSVEFLCMARVLNPVAVFSAFNPMIPCTAESSDEGWKLIMGDLWLTTLSEGELTRVFFGPGSPGGGRGDGVLPLPLWIWGLDGA